MSYQVKIFITGPRVTTEDVCAAVRIANSEGMCRVQFCTPELEVVDMEIFRGITTGELSRRIAEYKEVEK